MKALKLLLIVAIAALAPVRGEAMPDRHSQAPVPSIHWVACGEAFPGAECALAAVPLDHDRPRGPRTFLALARIPASDPAHRIGTIFVNPGGPGQSGVDMVLFGFGDYLSSLLRGRFDVVGFDPRGVSGSESVRCFESAEERSAFFAAVPVFPYRRTQEPGYFGLYRSLAERCLVDRDQRIAAHMSTADVARDLDLLRRAVGDPGLTYLGLSYGSFLGNTYANLFPRRIRALVIDGVLDPRLWAGGLQILSDRVNTAREFAEFLRLCDEAGSANCPLGGAEGAAARFEALSEAIRRDPLPFPDGSAYTYDLLVADAAYATYTPEWWGGPDGYGFYFAALADAVLGTPGALERAARTRRTLRQALEAAAPARQEYANSVEAFYGNHCADAEYPRLFPVWSAVGAFAEAGSMFGPFWWWNLAGCADWPTAADRYGGPWATSTSAPVLVVGNYFDGATSYEGAVATNRLLRGSRLLSYAGWGHTAFGRSDCATDHMVRYLLDGTLPLEGTVCPANPNPFLPAPLLRAGAARPLVGLPPARLLER